MNADCEVQLHKIKPLDILTEPRSSRRMAEFAENEAVRCGHYKVKCPEV